MWMYKAVHQRARFCQLRQGVENTWDEDQSAEVKRVVQGQWHKEREVQQRLHRISARGDRGFGSTAKTRERRLKKREPPDITSNGSDKKGILKS